MNTDSERPRKIAKVEHSTGDALQGTEPDGTLAEAAVTDSTVVTNGQQEEALAATDAAEQLGSAPAESAETPMSKNQLKKLRKQQKWEAGREERKQKRKAKAKEQKQRRRAAKQEAIKNGDLESDVVKQMRKQPSLQLPISIILDCNYDDLMLEKERVSLSSQLARSYADNGRGRYRCHLFISSFNKKLKERFDTVMHKHYQNWKNVVFTDEDYMHAASIARTKLTGEKGGFMEGPFAGKEAKPEEGEIIYLSSDSSDTLTELKPYCTYIIGGLVDKNRHKGVCYRSALANGLKTAKLPIGEYIKMASRQVLTTNHVVEIMIKWLELRDWGKAFELVIPKRKGGIPITKEESAVQEEDDDLQSENGDHEANEAQEHEAAEKTAVEDDLIASAAT